jgi:hypothetical protein
MITQFQFFSSKLHKNGFFFFLSRLSLFHTRSNNAPREIARLSQVLIFSQIPTGKKNNNYRSHQNCPALPPKDLIKWKILLIPPQNIKGKREREISRAKTTKKRNKICMYNIYIWGGVCDIFLSGKFCVR